MKKKMTHSIKKEIEIVHEMSRTLHCMDILKDYPADLNNLADKYIELKKRLLNHYPHEEETAPTLERYYSEKEI